MANDSDAIDSAMGDRVFRTGVALAVLATTAVLIRLVARWRTKAKTAGVDDILIIISLLPFYGMVTLSYLAVGSLSKPSDLRTFMKILMATIFTYSTAITLVKASILFLYRRIFDTAAFRLRTLVVGALCLAWCLISILIGVFQCRPFSMVFDYAKVFGGECVDVRAYWWGVCASNVILDVLVLCLPIHEVWKLHLPKQEKVLLSGIFALGGIVCIAGIMRIVSIGQVFYGDMNGLFREYAWSQVEPALAIICACIVTYRPLFIGIKFDLSKISSVFNLSRFSTGSKKELSSDSSQTELRWEDREDFDLRIPELSAKAADSRLHMVHMNFREPGRPAVDRRENGPCVV